MLVNGHRPAGRATPDAGTREAACTNCHGDTATIGRFKTVSHTPAQTGGFSDDDLVKIVNNATVPVGGYFDESIVALRPAGSGSTGGT